MAICDHIREQGFSTTNKRDFSAIAQSLHNSISVVSEVIMFQNNLAFGRVIANSGSLVPYLSNVFIPIFSVLAYNVSKIDVLDSLQAQRMPLGPVHCPLNRLFLQV